MVDRGFESLEASGDGGGVSRGHLSHRRDVFHAWMLEGANFSEDWEMPTLEPVDALPDGLVPFSEAMGRERDSIDCFVHFYEDDFRFESVWSNPSRYLPSLSRFAGVIMPDFSTSIDFPKPMKMWNAYRNRLLGSWFQRNGIVTIPNARAEPGCPWRLEGLPHHSTIAVCGRGLVKRPDERKRFIRDLRVTMDVLEPTTLVYYGSDLYGVLDYPRSLGIDVRVYPGAGRGVLDGSAHGQRC